MTGGRLKYALMLLGCLVAGLARGQTPGEGAVIRGVITDSATGVPVENVNVYLANTTRGGASALDGSFAIRGIPSGHYEMVVSRIGYLPRVVPLEIVRAESLFFSFTLVESVHEIAEHEVTEDRDVQWEKNYFRFQRAFLGESPHADDCTILNPEFLDFAFENDTLIASASAPLTLVNQALGYRLTIVLETFIWNVPRDAGTYKIYPLFEQLPPASPGEESRWREHRMAAWKGSLTHFLMTLYHGNSESEQFTILIGPTQRLLSGQGHRVHSSEFPWTAVVGTTYREFTMPNSLRVEFGSPEPADDPPLRRPSKRSLVSAQSPPARNASLITVKGGTVIVGPEGNLQDPLAIEVTGTWGKSRVAELLPRP